MNKFDKNKFLAPPDFIDGAKVIKWAWSGHEPFGYVGNLADQESKEVYGLAICQYEAHSDVYRFSCDKDWNVVQDGLYDTVENAIKQLPDQYKNVIAEWQSK